MIEMGPGTLTYAAAETKCADEYNGRLVILNNVAKAEMFRVIMDLKHSETSTTKMKNCRFH